MFFVLEETEETSFENLEESAKSGDAKAQAKVSSSERSANAVNPGGKELINEKSTYGFWSFKLRT